jgi:pimeloyl-ACP methyl ester carboxylesterase
MAWYLKGAAVMPTIDIGERSLRYEVRGEGDPLLMIAGLASDWSSWDGVVGELSARFRTVVFDNRGCGRSESPGEDFTIGDMAEDAVRLMDILGIPQAHIVGHSMGGYIAQEIALRHPDRVGKLMLVSSALFSSRRNNALFTDLSWQLKNGEYEAWLRRLAFWLFAPRCFESPDFLDSLVRETMARPYRASAQGFCAQVAALASFDARGRADQIRSRTLVLAGEKDILILPGEAKALAEAIPDSIFHEIEDAGHSLPVERPRSFIDEVTAFLAP